jgi:uncharacterized damage-inducible protein DinB
MQHLSLAPFYQGWDSHQQHLVQALAPLTNEDLAYSVIPRWSVGRIAAHICAARIWWFHVRMGEGSMELAPMEHWDGAAQPARSAEELVNGLERSWHIIESALARWTPADLEHVFPARSNDPTERTRQWIIWHVMEHDIHHGGEISCILGMYGLPPVELE